MAVQLLIFSDLLFGILAPRDKNRVAKRLINAIHHECIASAKIVRVRVSREVGPHRPERGDQMLIQEQECQVSLGARLVAARANLLAKANLWRLYS